MACRSTCEDVYKIRSDFDLGYSTLGRRCLLVELRQAHTLSEPPPQLYHIPSLNNTSSSNPSSHADRAQNAL